MQFFGKQKFAHIWIGHCIIYLLEYAKCPSTMSRVVGGRPAAQKEYPWQVTFPRSNVGCGGTLVSAKVKKFQYQKIKIFKKLKYT